MIFIDLRDREGITQCVLYPAAGLDAFSKAEHIRSEFVVAVKGTVNPRPPETVNPRIPTGEIEVLVSEMKVLNESRPLPFQIESAADAEVDETLRLKYRYLDMRRASVLKGFQIRDLLCRAGHLPSHPADRRNQLDDRVLGGHRIGQDRRVHRPAPPALQHPGKLSPPPPSGSQ